eukprot:905139-Rhodomonas_salina.2
MPSCAKRRRLSALPSCSPQLTHTARSPHSPGPPSRLFPLMLPCRRHAIAPSRPPNCAMPTALIVFSLTSRCVSACRSHSTRASCPIPASPTLHLRSSRCASPSHAATSFPAPSKPISSSLIWRSSSTLIR